MLKPFCLCKEHYIFTRASHVYYKMSHAIRFGLRPQPSAVGSCELGVTTVTAQLLRGNRHELGARRPLNSILEILIRRCTRRHPTPPSPNPHPVPGTVIRRTRMHSLYLRTGLLTRPSMMSRLLRSAPCLLLWCRVYQPCMMSRWLA